MISLKGKHSGETAWIVGKGPSLKRLKLTDIGDGPVIAIYEAIIPIEQNGFENPLYSLQKDGGLRKRHPFQVSSECDYKQCDACDGIVRPQMATLLLHKLESENCFEDYPKRYVFTLSEIGMAHNEFSLVCAIKIAQFMGCEKFCLVSCDAHAIGDFGNCVPILSKEYYEWIYRKQREILPQYLEGLDFKWITPSG